MFSILPILLIAVSLAGSCLADRSNVILGKWEDHIKDGRENGEGKFEDTKFVVPKAKCLSYPGKVACRIGDCVFLVNTPEDKLDPETLEKFAAIVYQKSGRKEDEFQIGVNSKKEVFPISPTAKPQVLIQCKPLNEESLKGEGEVQFVCDWKEYEPHSNLQEDVEKKPILSENRLKYSVPAYEEFRSFNNPQLKENVEKFRNPRINQPMLSDNHFYPGYRGQNLAMLQSNFRPKGPLLASERASIHDVNRAYQGYNRASYCENGHLDEDQFKNRANDEMVKPETKMHPKIPEIGVKDYLEPVKFQGGFQKEAMVGNSRFKRQKSLAVNKIGRRFARQVQGSGKCNQCPQPTVVMCPVPCITPVCCTTVDRTPCNLPCPRTSCGNLIQEDQDLAGESNSRNVVGNKESRGTRNAGNEDLKSTKRKFEKSKEKTPEEAREPRQIKKAQEESKIAKDAAKTQEEAVEKKQEESRGTREANQSQEETKNTLDVKEFHKETVKVEFQEPQKSKEECRETRGAKEEIRGPREAGKILDEDKKKSDAEMILNESGTLPEINKNLKEEADKTPKKIENVDSQKISEEASENTGPREAVKPSRAQNSAQIHMENLQNDSVVPVVVEKTCSSSAKSKREAKLDPNVDNEEYSIFLY